MRGPLSKLILAIAMMLIAGSGLSLEMLQSELPVSVSSPEELGEFWWVVVDVDATTLDLPTDPDLLRLCQAWLELSLTSGESYAELDWIVLPAGADVAALISEDSLPSEDLEKLSVRGPDTYRIDLSAALQEAAAEGAQAQRLVLGRLDPTALGEVELLGEDAIASSVLVVHASGQGQGG
jgi:hypothetical protein